MAVKRTNFGRSFAQLMRRVRGRELVFVRALAIDLGTDMVMRSPVDTGRFKNNWFTSIGGANLTTTTGTDASGGQSIARIHMTMQGYTLGDHIFITNSLPYAERLEHGWSQQAPNGMVRLALQSFRVRLQTMAAEAAR